MRTAVLRYLTMLRRKITKLTHELADVKRDSDFSRFGEAMLSYAPCCQLARPA